MCRLKWGLALPAPTRIRQRRRPLGIHGLRNQRRTCDIGQFWVLSVLGPHADHLFRPERTLGELDAHVCFRERAMELLTTGMRAQRGHVAYISMGDAELRG